MTDLPASDDRDELPVELARLRNAIACELHAQLALRNERIGLEDVPGVSCAVAVHLGHAFRIEWAPPWQTEHADDESLGLDAATFHGSDAPGRPGATEPERYPIFDHGWPPANA